MIIPQRRADLPAGVVGSIDDGAGNKPTVTRTAAARKARARIVRMGDTLSKSTGKRNANADL